MVELSERIAKMQSGITNRIAKGLTRGWIRTIEDLERATYGFTASDLIQKADTPIVTSTTGARNVLVGARLWQQIQTQANAFGAMGAKPWDKSGYRALTAAAATTSPAISEAGAIPDTIKPTIAEITVPPGVSAGSFDMSSTQMKLAGKDDVVEWPDLVEYMGKEFKNRLNRAVLADADTPITTGLDSLDRVIASYAEIAYGGVAGGAYTANDLDIYGQDRDAAASWVDAYVSGLLAASGNRDLALTHIDACFTNTRPYYEDPSTTSNKVMITGYDTLERIEQLYQSQMRIPVPVKTVQMTVGGIKTLVGVDVGLDVATYKGVPIIPDANVLQDTISRIYGVDLDNLWLGTLQPVTYLESSDYQAIDKFATEGVYYMEGQIVCTKFKSQFKVRDLK